MDDSTRDLDTCGLVLLYYHGKSCSWSLFYFTTMQITEGFLEWDIFKSSVSAFTDSMIFLPSVQWLVSILVFSKSPVRLAVEKWPDISDQEQWLEFWGLVSRYYPENYLYSKILIWKIFIRNSPKTNSSSSWPKQSRQNDEFCSNANQLQRILQ